MNQNKIVDIYSADIEFFKRYLYYKDADEFLSIVMLDIDNNFYENINDLLIQIPFLKKCEIEKLKSHFDSKTVLDMVA